MTETDDGDKENNEARKGQEKPKMIPKLEHKMVPPYPNNSMPNYRLFVKL